jgi:uncharacterized membrane protein
MARKSGVLMGSGLGAGIMYLWDPEQGERRRALIRDQVIHARRTLGRAAGKVSRDTANRLEGFLAETRSLLFRDNASDEVLAERVRSKIGRVSTHPAAIEVRVESGRAILSGPILSDEVDRVLAAARRVPGIQGVENQLEAHDEPGNIPALQGAPANRQELSEFAQENWTPALRFLAGFTGAWLAYTGFRKRGLVGGTLGKAVGLAGLGLLARGAANKPLNQIIGAGASRRAVDLQKSINIDAPVERVFEYWSRFENFPRFMTHVREVRGTGPHQSHWVVQGPLGAPVEWDAVITQFIPNRVLAWKTLPNSLVQHGGIVRFDTNPDGGTRVDVQMSYNPGAGALGHAAAKLLGADPKAQMDDDLLRLKTFLETGATPRGAAKKKSRKPGAGQANPPQAVRNKGKREKSNAGRSEHYASRVRSSHQRAHRRGRQGSGTVGSSLPADRGGDSPGGRVGRGHGRGEALP